MGSPRYSRDLAVQLIPLKQSRVRLIAQLEKKKTMRRALTRSRSPSPAATQMFFCWRTILDERRGIRFGIRMMGDAIEREDVGSVHTWEDYLD